MNQCLIEDNSFSRPTGTKLESVLDFLNIFLSFKLLFCILVTVLSAQFLVIGPLCLEDTGSFLLNRELCCSHVLLLNQLVATRTRWVDDVLEFFYPFATNLEKAVYCTANHGTD